MDNRGSGNRDELSTEEPFSQLSLSASHSTSGEIASRFSNSSYLSFLNVRLTPRFIAFIDAFEGKHFSVDISIQNIGKSPITVAVGQPKSFIFQLKKPSSHPIFLASGGSIKGAVSYTYHKAHLVQSSEIPLLINGRLLHYPIFVKPAHPEIEVEPKKLHFKVINLGASAKTMALTITNSGGIRTKFEIDVGKNRLGLIVHPSRGTIRAKESTKIFVEMMGLMEGEFYQELWLTTDGAHIRIPVLVEVVWPQLKIKYPKGTKEITLIDFRPTFIGTQRLASFTLNNFGAEITSYVIFAEVNGELEVLKNAQNTVEEFGMFIFKIQEGHLQPFENRTLSVVFCPKAEVKNKGWHAEEKSNRNKREFIIFIRINRVHCLEWKEYESKIQPNNYIAKDDKDSFDYNQSSLSTHKGLPLGLSSAYDYQNKEEFLRLCLHGQAIEPDITLQPTSLDFGHLKVGEQIDRVLRITNNNTVAVKCNLCKTANIKTTPNEVWLQGEKSQEFLVSVSPKNSGIFKSQLKVQVFARSDAAFNSNNTMEMIAVYTVNFTYTAKHIILAPQPKLVLGITPLVVDDVGQNKDLVTYKDVSELPFAAMLGLKQGFKPTWMHREKDQLNNVENAIVALPNDRPRNFTVWPADKICRAIFSGYFRYSPPEDPSYTFTPEERNEKEKHCAKWMDYISLLRKIRLNKTKLKNIKCLIQYDLSSCKEFSSRKLFKNDLESYENNLGISKANENPLKNTLVPLSALCLIRINVNPKLINFNMVAVNTKAQESVTIHNMNPFHIRLKFISGNSAVSLKDDSAFIVPPMATKSVDIFFETNALGRYFGFLNYIINECHEFKISIFAIVLPKTLIIKKEYTTIEFAKFEPKDAFQSRSSYLYIENPIQIPVKYHWAFPSDSMYTSEIIHGEIPPRSVLLTEIFYKLNPKKIFYSEAKFISEDGSENLIKLFKPYNKVVVNFLEEKVNMGDVPLNLPTKVKAVIENSCYHDVVFELLNANPLPGIAVEPKKGIIKRRSSFALEINVQIPIMMKFSFEVQVNVDFVNKISATVVGKVVPPNIRMKPSKVTIQKICVQSFDIFTVCFENVGTTPAEIAIDLQSFPEFSIEKNQEKLYLFPKESSKITIRFDPANATRYFFYLPIILNNLLGPPSNHREQTEFVSFYVSQFIQIYQNYKNVTRSKGIDLKLPCVSISSQVSPCILKISPMNLDFKMENKLHLPPQTVEILNVFTSNVTFCIRNDDLGEINNSPFNLKPVSVKKVENRHRSIKVELQPEEKLTLSATFKPEKPGIYKAEIPLFVKGYNEGLVYNYIRMTGEFKPPRISSNVLEIHFSPVPLNVGSETTLTIIAENYHCSDLISCLISKTEEDHNETQNCLTTQWLGEPRITEKMKNSIFHLRIKFESSSPIALRNYILLFDSTGRYTSVLVTAVADNSVITNYAFISSKSSKYKIVKDTPTVQKLTVDELLLKFPIKKSDLTLQEKIQKLPKKSKSKSYTGFSFDDTRQSLSGIIVNPTNNPSSLTLDRGPKLIMNTTKSIENVSKLHFVNIHKNLGLISEENKSTSSDSKKTSLKSTLSLATSQSSSGEVSSTSDNYFYSTNNKIHMLYTTEESFCGYFPKTRDFVERWIYEVVMRCEQYISIPESFQHVREVESSKNTSGEKADEETASTDFIDFLIEIVGNDQSLPHRPSEKKSSEEADKIASLRKFFGDILEYLREKGCLLPHIRPEHLLEYKCYAEYMQSQDENVEIFSWTNSDDYEVKKKSNSKTEVDKATSKVASEKEAVNIQNSASFLARDSWKKLPFENLSLYPEGETEKFAEENSGTADISKQYFDLSWGLSGKQFQHEIEVLDQQTFTLISTQAWLDIITQIFKVFVLNKIVPKNGINQIMVIEMHEKIPSEVISMKSVRNSSKKIKEDLIVTEPSHSNIYSYQEKMLLTWLNNHLQIQKGKLWNSKDECFFKTKIINNFDTDLSDSVALLSVTASHCPYIVSSYFNDVFLKPDSPNKKQHNAGKLIEAWRDLEIGLTVETADIIRPNSTFMTMLVTHLYDVLPGRYPHSLIYFSCPLSAGISRKFPVKNESDKRLVLRPKFFGEYEGYFSLSEPLIHLKPSSVTNIGVKFKAKKIEHVSAVLLLSGCVESPNFANSLTYYLEGKPSEIPECEKFSFSAPLYKVICSDIPLNPPVHEPTTYEIWYTTKQPEYTDNCSYVKTLFTPWSKIWSRKLSRRLFINTSNVHFKENVPMTLDVTMACFTNEKRFFWLLFRSKVSDFIIRIEIKTKMSEEHVITVFNTEFDSMLKTCDSSDQNGLKPSDCSFLTELKIPMRNENLWKALRTMFFKTLLPQEKSFWYKHFEMDIGLCLILWLLRPDEEEQVLEEFVQVLPTKVNYILNVQPSNDYVTLPQKVEISDVRKTGHIIVPLYISNKAPPTFDFELLMVAENTKEIRNLKVIVEPSSSSRELDKISTPNEEKNSLCLLVGEMTKKPEEEQKSNQNLKFTAPKI